MFCQNCGQQNPDAARFCGRCGAALTVRTVNAEQPRYQAPVPQQPQYQPTQYQPTQYQPPVPAKTKSKSPLIAIILVVALLAAGVAGFLVFGGSATTFGAVAELRDWNWVELTYNTVNIGTIRRATTGSGGEIDDLWIELMDAKLRPTSKNLEYVIRDTNYAEVFFVDESGEVWLQMLVSEDGQVFLSDSEDRIASYTGAKDLHQLLNDRLFPAESASLEDAVAAAGWEGIGIYLYDKNGECIDSAIGLNPETAEAVVREVRKLDVKYGGGLCYAPKGYEAMLQLWDANETYYYIMVYDDGNADIPFGDWTYGFYSCGDLYELLVASMETVYQMG